MKRIFAASLLSALMFAGCQTPPVQRVAVPSAQDPNAYQATVQEKPLPPDAGGQPMQPMPGQPMQPMQPVPPGQPVPVNPQPGSSIGAPHSVLPSEEAFVQAYSAHRSPRIMVFVNRTLQGDTLPKDQMDELIRVEEKQTATGGVKVASDQSASSGTVSVGSSASIYGSSSGTVNSGAAKNDKTSFESGGPATYTRTTSVRVAADKVDEIGATATDYEMIELSIIDYMDSGGRVQIRDSQAARAKLDREKILRIENSDPAAVRLLNSELQTDVLIQVKAVPTSQSTWTAGQPGGGKAVRMLAKATSTTDGRILASAFVDMPLPITKTNVNVFTRYLAEKTMQKMAAIWSGNPEWDPIEVRVYKVASVDDSLKIRKFMQAIKGVQSVNSSGATGSSTTSYAAFRVGYVGAPEDFYGDLKDALGHATGLKATDLQNNTIVLEVTGPMNLTTTTRTTETKTTVETKTTEEKHVDPIQPAPGQ